ncbi:hypothetical protein CHLNCDRAFT_140556 [Chlorella variabilis]|uniref:TNFR-Cys domain-containing protein n=1 Tax=Chlorella variabilis TaxID=554065 RepID=E1Z5N7_CHLVA|nr:hypothetical protein CHLNCDRAFT_140556 [Chlorella variabilis]EFN58505.1 hypothetical protein CHLNCDRAFT_140556 [Chlorella variabilis]|eukprot:XP_005850607.1 hypothetical protein CHLNCDRAFT_140556 [Chlorella variabilis]
MCYDQLCSECDARKVLCTQCISNYFKDGDGFCTKCADPLCERCGPSAATCKKCTAADFNLDKNPLVYKDSRGRCRHCAFSIHGSCKACNSTGTCARCASGHYMDAAGSCKRCPDPLCVRCTGPKGKTCVKCETGFYEEDDFEQPSYPVYLTATGSCAKCTKQPWYKGCRACKEGGACTRCEEGFRLSSKGTCNPCADDRCAECAPNLIKCLKCMDVPIWAENPYEYGPIYMTKTGKCRECEKHLRDNGCEACDETGQCTRCTPTVDDSPNSPTVYLSKGICKQCPDDCKECRPDGSCHTCANGYRKTLKGDKCVQCKDYSKCVRCTDGMLGCQKCSADGLRCEDCSGMTGHDKKCRKCANPLCECKKDASICTGCRYVPGKALWLDTRANTCRECAEGCSYDCTKDGCPFCDDGYVKVGKACKRECNATGKTCKLCKFYTAADNSPGSVPVYMDKAGRCQKCAVKGCEECRNDGTCRTFGCRYGYVNKNGKCVV